MSVVSCMSVRSSGSQGLSGRSQADQTRNRRVDTGPVRVMMNERFDVTWTSGHRFCLQVLNNFYFL